MIFLFFAAVSSVSEGFRLTGEGESVDHGLFGESGLNAIPRIGRRSIGVKPFDNRFRFRFSDWLGPTSSRYGGGNAGFRFQGGESNENRNWQLKKRMAQSIARDKRNFMKEGELAEPELEIVSPVGDNLALLDGIKEKQQQVGKVFPSEGSSSIESELAWYAIADQYWKEYLTDLRRKAAIEKLVKTHRIAFDIKVQ